MPTSIADIIMLKESDGFSSGTTMFYAFDRGPVLGRFNNVSVPIAVHDAAFATVL